MEYTINDEGQKVADKLDWLDESYDVFVVNGGEFLGTADTYNRALLIRDESKYPNNKVQIWDNRTNN